MMTSKKILILVLLLATTFIPQMTFALSQSEATNEYKQELILVGLPENEAQKKSSVESKILFELMENSQRDVEISLEALKKRVSTLNKNDGRREEVMQALGMAEEKVGEFTNMTAQDEFDFQESIAGALPRLLASSDFESAKFEATEAMGAINKILILPERPGVVPEGDIVLDFIPQLVRQLFRFAWLAVLIAFTVSGITFIIAKDNDDRITKAKSMIYYSFLGFAVIAFAFAVVKGITDIDFFGFI